MKKAIPVCYYPTTIILIDDNEKYLNNLHLGLSKDYCCKLFTNSYQALQYLNESYQPSPFIAHVATSEEDLESDHMASFIDTRTIRNEVFRPQRFAEISIVIVDYMMPNVNGLQLCERLNHSHIKKIMLTGEADESTAINAFNAGIIDKFILKSTANLIDVINDAVIQMQQQYFITYSEQLFAPAMLEYNKGLNCLHDPQFIDHFMKVCRDNHIVEYYLTDSEGGFLLLNKQASPSWLAVKSHEDLQSYYEFAADSEGVPPTVLQAIQSESKIPYFFTDQDLQTPPNKWQPYLHDAIRVQGDTTYHIAYIDDPKAYEFDSNRILSYQAYHAENE